MDATGSEHGSVVAPSLWSINNPTGTNGLIGIDKLGDAIRFFDPVTLAEIKSIDHKNHHQVAISPDHKTAYVTEFGKFAAGKFVESGTHISVVNLDRKEIVHRIPTGDYLGPHAMRFDGRGGLWVIFEETGELGRLDLETLKLSDVYVIGAQESRPPFIEMTPDGGKIYVSSKGGDLIVFDAVKRAVLTKIAVPSGTEGIAMSPDGSRLYAAENTRQDLLVIDTSTEKIVDTIALKGAVLSNPAKSRLVRLRFSPDGRFLVSVNYVSGVAHIHDGANPKEHIMVPIAKGPQGIAFTPDNACALVTNHDCGLMTKIDLQQARATDWYDAGKGLEAITYY